jgi:cysteine desulfurase/selenocysteine lyase
MMTDTTNPLIPSEAELTALANQLMGALDGSAFEEAESMRAAAPAYAPTWDWAEQAIEATQPTTQSAPQAYAPTVVSQRHAENREIRVAAVSDTSASNTSNRDAQTIIGSKSLAQIKADFPILAEKVNGHPLIWMDNGATTQRPRAVIDRLTYFYEHENSNVHRSAHTMAARATDAYENARQTVANFIGAPEKSQLFDSVPPIQEDAQPKRVSYPERRLPVGYFRIV